MRDMTKGAPLGHLFLYAVPLLLGNWLQLAYNAVDSIIAGRFIGQEALAAEGINVEVLDLRSLAPIDKDTIFDSVRKTHHAIVVEESNKICGIGSEIASMLQEELYDELDGPVLRVAALDVPLPYDVDLEHYCIPDADNIYDAVKRAL